MNEMKMCQVCPDLEASHQFVWAWGEEGFCSTQGQSLLLQQARNLKREISFHPIQTIVAPITREERHRLIADKLAAESEREDTAQRAGRLYEQNVELAAELKAQRLKVQHLEATSKGLEEQLSQAKTEVTRLSKANGQLTLKVLESEKLLLNDPLLLLARELAGENEEAQARVDAAAQRTSVR